MSDFSAENEKTIECLMCWSKHLVEKLGWMMIKKEKKDPLADQSIALYKAHINQIIKDLETKVKHTIEQDRKNEILIVHAQMKNLRDIVNKAFSQSVPEGLAGGAKSKKSSKKSPKKSSKKSSKKMAW